MLICTALNNAQQRDYTIIEHIDNSLSANKTKLFVTFP